MNSNGPSHTHAHTPKTSPIEAKKNLSAEDQKTKRAKSVADKKWSAAQTDETDIQILLCRSSSFRTGRLEKGSEEEELEILKELCKLIRYPANVNEWIRKRGLP